MVLSRMEKEYLARMVRREIEHFKKDAKVRTMDVQFLKAEHDLKHFLEGLLKKLEG